MAFVRPIRPRLSWLLAAALVFTPIGAGYAQTTTFTYQGRLYDNASPVTGSYDLEFKLFDTAPLGTGTQQGSTLSVPAVQVVGGLFTVPLDFGLGVFPGADRFLEIGVKRPGDSTFTTLAPRQALTSTPYALRSLAATEADGLSVACVSCVTSSQIQSVQGGQISGTIPVASVPAGSANYIQNGTSLQASADFNISGNGSAAILVASTQFNLGSNRILGQPGTNNLAAGVNAGASNTTGTANAFFGQNAGQNNTTGSSNEFFGYNAGNRTTTGGNNSFFGDAAGFFNVTGSSNAFFGFLAGFNTNASFNSFFGTNAGAANTTGQFNSLFGTSAGVNSTTASSNSFFGYLAGPANSTGGANSFFGHQVALNNTTGSFNSFFGQSVGLGNTTGFNNTLIGAGANVGATNLDHATAIGAGAVVGASSTVVLGRNVDTTLVAGTLNVAGSLLSFAGSRILSNAGTNNLFAGVGTGSVNTGAANAFFGTNAGQSNTTANSNAFFGSFAGSNITTGSSNSFFGSFAGGSTDGKLNSYFGASAGSGSTGDQNAFFGQVTGLAASGSFNTFIGQAAGNNPGSGGENVFVGWLAGSAYGTAGFNTFVGSRAGFTVPVPPDPTGSSNTAVGAQANVTAGLFGATAVGAFARVTQNNSLVLGSSSVRVGIGNTAPQARLHITDAGTNIFLGEQGCGGAFGGIRFSAAAGCTTYSLLGGDGSTYVNRPSGGAIHFREGNFEQLTINPGGTVAIVQLGAAGATPLCRNASSQISFCSSSLRYKTELTSFSGGMELVSRLRPIAFKWKNGGAPDLGLGAEEVAQVEPLLVTRNDKGEIEGVKYDHLSVVFINALMELQAQLDEQRRALKRQEREIEGLRKLLDQPGSAGSGAASSSTRPSGRAPDLQ